MFSDEVAPYRYPLDWLSARPSNPAKVLERHGTQALVKLVESMRPGDELRKFRSPRLTWSQRTGRIGFALIRDGSPIGMAVVRMN